MPEFSGATAKLNLVEPKVFADYVLEQQTATNRLLSSGILTTDPIIQAQLLKGGTYVTIPTLQSLSGEAQTWNDTSDITVGNVDSYSAIAPQMYQAKAFGYTDFGQLSTGAPVAEQIAGQFASFWNIQDNKLLIAVLKNAFLNADLQAVKSYGMDTPAPLAAGDFIAALSRMGDVASPQLTKIVLNSAAVGAMRDQNLIDTIQPSNGGTPISYYNGIEIVEDDALPVAADGTTDAFIIANGAVSYGLAIQKTAMRSSATVLAMVARLRLSTAALLQCKLRVRHSPTLLRLLVLATAQSTLLQHLCTIWLVILVTLVSLTIASQSTRSLLLPVSMSQKVSAGFGDYA